MAAGSKWRRMSSFVVFRRHLSSGQGGDVVMFRPDVVTMSSERRHFPWPTPPADSEQEIGNISYIAHRHNIARRGGQVDQPMHRAVSG